MVTLSSSSTQNSKSQQKGKVRIRNLSDTNGVNSKMRSTHSKIKRRKEIDEMKDQKQDMRNLGNGI